MIGGTWTGTCEWKTQSALCTLMRPGQLVTSSIVDHRFVHTISGLVWFHVRTPHEFACVTATITYKSDESFGFALQQGTSLTDFEYLTVPASGNTWSTFSYAYSQDNLRYNPVDKRYQASIKTEHTVILDRFTLVGMDYCSL